MLKKFMAWVLAGVFVCSVNINTIAETIKYGDATGNGILQADDAAAVLQKVLNDEYILPVEGNGNWLKIVDVSNDGSLGADDAAIILQKVLKDSYVMPVEDVTETTTEVVEITTDESTEATTEVVEITTDESTETTTEATTKDGYSFIVENHYSANDQISANEVLYSDNYGVIKAGQLLSCASTFDETGGFDYASRLQTNSVNSAVVIDGSSYNGSRVAMIIEVLQDCWVSIDYRLYMGKTTYIGEGTAIDNLTCVYKAENTSSTSASYETAVFKAEAGKTYYFFGVGTNPYFYAVDFSYTEPETQSTTKATETTTESTTEEPTESTTNNTDGVVVGSFSQLQNAVNNSEPLIYINGTIQCTAQLKLSKSNANIKLIGLTNEDGTGATLDFAKFRDSRTSSGESGTGIYISGSGYGFSDLIIQNAGDCGVRIKGSGSGNCTFTNCVFRYNNNSGLSITSGGSDNKFYNCDSYRNGDIVQKSGADADGYSVKLAAGGGNYFYNCRAWENSDDGWDSYDRGDLIPDITYIECLAWHNGNPDTFTGEYDYAQGYPLDKNLVYVQAILKADPDFEAKYNAREITEWPNVTMSLLGTTNNYTNLYNNWGGNPNGFKFGSSATTTTPYRYIKNCIAFDHYGNTKEVQVIAKGFDQNNGSASYDLENTLSFNNVENYQMVNMVAKSINGVVWGFDSCADVNGEMHSDEPSEGMTITVPENKEEIKAKVYAYRDTIYDYVYNDKIPGEMICDVFN